MKLSKKTFLYSIILAAGMVALVIVYFVLMLPSLYVDYVMDSNLQSVEMDEELKLTPEFPYNWMYDGAREKGEEPFVLKLSCKALVLVFKDSGEAQAGKADVFVDGEKKLTADPHINGWIHCNPVILIQEEEEKKHEIQIRMAPGEEGKEFTILGFGYVSSSR